MAKKNQKKIQAILAAQNARLAAANAAARRNASPRAGGNRGGGGRNRKSKIGSAAGRMALGALGNMIPIPGASFLGGALGDYVGGKIGTMLGLGEYELKQNSFVGAGLKAQQPRILDEGNAPAHMHTDVDLCIITKREFIGKVLSGPTLVGGATTFNVNNFAIQPGLDTTFPWAKIQAQGYSEWVPLGIAFEFLTTTGANSSPSGAVGSVMMATDYDAFDTVPFPDQVTMLNAQGSVSKPTTEPVRHLVECKPDRLRQDRLLIRTGAPPAGQPLTEFDLGVFSIATVGQPTANQVLGELWASYQIGLSKSTMKNVTTTSVEMDAFILTPAIPAATLGSAVPNSFNSLGGTTSAASTYTFPPNLAFGTYRVQWRTVGSVASLFSGFTIVPNTSCALIPGGLDPVGGATVITVPSSSASSVIATGEALVKITAQGAAFQVACAVGPAGGSPGAGLLTVCQWDAAIDT